MGDELDDGILLDDTLVAYSDEEHDSGNFEEKGDVPDVSAEPAAQKKRKRREQSKMQRRKKAASLQEQAAAALSVAQQTNDIQADYLRTLQRKAFPKLSDMELQEISVPARNLLESFDFKTERTLDHLPEFIRHCTSSH